MDEMRGILNGQSKILSFISTNCQHLAIIFIKFLKNQGKFGRWLDPILDCPFDMLALPRDRRDKTLSNVQLSLSKNFLNTFFSILHILVLSTDNTVINFFDRDSKAFYVSLVFIVVRYRQRKAPRPPPVK